MGCFGRKEKKNQCTIILLDETEISEMIEHNTKGEDLLQKVYKHLNLLETAYFGLRYLNKNGESRWLDPLLKVSKQLKGLSPFTLYFGVKFYASDPCKLLEEITRYQFVLQLKQDIFQGRLPLTPDLAAELFALSLQAELGDYDPRKHHKLYVSEFRFCPEQGPELEDKVEKIHKSLVGKVPSAVEMTFLEKVKWLDMYGVDLHRVLGDDHIEYFLGLTPSGVIVMKNKIRMSNYFWPRISKVFFKGKYFMIRVRDKSNDEITYGFLLISKESCEYLWKCCVEHHAFFRLSQVKDISANSMQLFRLGSKYRYSGRTEQQIRNDMKKIRRSPPPIVRVPSRRFQKRLGEPDGADADAVEKEIFKRNLINDVKDDLEVLKTDSSSPLYRSVSTPAGLSAIEQQKLVEINPWEYPNHRGLFSSRQSLASSRGSERRSGHRSHHKRSSSVDSQTSTDSRHRRRHHRNKRNSDNESEISKSSRGSRSSRNGSSHKKIRSHSRESGSESDSHHRSRRRKHSSRRTDSNYHLVDSESQWKQVQKLQKEKEQAKLQNAVVRDLSKRKSGYMNSGMDTETEAPSQRKKKHRSRHSRSRSRSPEPQVISQEVKKHLQYRLVDPINLTEEEKRDIKYTKVESETNGFKIKYSPTSGKPRYKVSKVSSRTSLDTLSRRSAYDEDPPPPYTVDLSPNGRTSHERSKRREDGVQHSHVVKLGNQRSQATKTSLEPKRNNHCNDTVQSQKESLRKHENKHQRRKKLELPSAISKGKRDISTEL